MDKRSKKTYPFLMDIQSKKLMSISYVISCGMTLGLFLNVSISTENFAEQVTWVFGLVMIAIFGAFIVALVLGILIEIFKALEKWIMK